MAKYPIETKTIAGVIGAGGGVELSKFVLWVMGVAIWHIPYDASHADAAVAAVPSPVSGIVTLFVTALAAGILAYVAPHTARPVVVPPVNITPAKDEPNAAVAAPTPPLTGDLPPDTVGSEGRLPAAVLPETVLDGAPT